MRKLTRRELIQALKKAEKNPQDRIGVIGELGCMGVSGAGSGALASALFSTTATTTATAPVLGSTFLGNILGATVTVTTVAAAPATAVAVGVGGGILLTCGLITLIKSGFNSNHKRTEYIRRLKEKIADYDRKMIGIADRNEKMSKIAGIYGLLFKLKAITAEKAESILAGIHSGAIDVDVALSNAKAMLQHLNQGAHAN